MRLASLRELARATVTPNLISGCAERGGAAGPYCARLHMRGRGPRWAGYQQHGLFIDVLTDEG
jgi:hypothetical protein